MGVLASIKRQLLLVKIPSLLEYLRKSKAAIENSRCDPKDLNNQNSQII